MLFTIRFDKFIYTRYFHQSINIPDYLPDYNNINKNISKIKTAFREGQRGVSRNQ